MPEQRSAIQRQPFPDEEEARQMKPLARSWPALNTLQPHSSLVTRHPSPANSDSGFEAGSHFERRLSVAGKSGRPLPGGLRTDFEPKFGVDLGSVRMHTDREATQMNRQLGSRAFTHGQDIYFGGGQYQPETTGGKQLIAHELTHTVQQGASTDRISAWWPKGHRLVTELGFKNSAVRNRFDDEAEEFLIDNTPDMDYIQDVFDAMGAGEKIGDTRLELYGGLIKAGLRDRAQGEEDSAQEKLDRARDMYENNELHIRRPVYMLMHGEAGEYKMDRDAAAARNEAVTNKFVEKAAAEWPGVDGDADAKIKSLIILSDALHQAADRGSHEEGAALQGHDVRLQLGIPGKGKFKQSWPKQPWEHAFGGSKEEQSEEDAQAGKAGPKWDTDNFVVNDKGAVLGAAFVEGSLGKFIQGIQGEKLPNGLKVSLRKLKLPKRRKIKKGIKVSSKSIVTSLVVTVKGKTGLGVKGTLKERKKDRTKLREVFDETQKTMLGDYQEARQVIGDIVPVDFENLLAEGMAFYDTGVKRENTIAAAKTQFQDWKKPVWRGGLKKEDRREQAKVYFNTKITEAQNDPNRDAVVVATHIKAAYKDVFGEELTGVTDPVDGPKTDYDLEAEAYAGAHAHFKHWGKNVFTITERRKLARRYFQRHNNKSQIEKDAIKMAYKNLFGEEIPTEAHEKFREWGQSRVKGGSKKRTRRLKALEYIKGHSATPEKAQEARAAYTSIFGSSLGAEFRANFKQIRQRFKKNTSVGAFEKRHSRLKTVDTYLQGYERREKAGGDKTGRKQFLESTVIPTIINPLITERFFRGRFRNIHKELVTLKDILQEIVNDLTAEIENEANN
jgi:hypothetical protein